jgi:hypothetical protein
MGGGGVPVGSHATTSSKRERTCKNMDIELSCIIEGITLD